ncbi:hypothetical protein [Desulfosudis oleivorans]|uniref:Uncharacterized protein n=1 Tax=Desulfosudis oleivorans (strain DSM 6200 / JCM 39069 / Hxd3) TaxID=96561 RepID=A8ZX01_DESOH|nr:hypothetical protein [Desulfosudis oleivorans]ABW66857.1 hypothetical protein Dole_1047 [Desulfosudis oleivorans Hxd3]
MKKKWAIVFLVIVAIWIAFLVYRHFKNKEDENQYVAQTFSGMTLAAQKSPKAGLTYMGMAINNYRAQHNKYPETLDALYPNHIQDRAFIDEVNWEYAFDQNNFRLTKTVVIDHRPYTAFVDSQLRPLDVGADGQVRTAAAERRPASSGAASSQAGARRSSTRRQDTVARPPEPIPERTATKEELEALKEQLLASLAAAGKQGPAPEEKEKAPPVVYTPVEDAEDVDEAVAGRHLTWKTETGALGFGNVMYPGGEDNLIYRKGKWIRVQRTQEETAVAQPVQTSGLQPEDADLARKYGRTYLAWKDQSGAMGFGNVSYPEKEEGLVYQNEQWVKASEQQINKPAESWLSPPFSDTNDMVQKYTGTHLTWKDKSGALGFGNVTYPDQGQLAVYRAGRWVDTAQTTPADILENPLAYSVTSPDHVGKKYGKDFFVWKDRSGALGFGNILPEQAGITVMRPDGSWADAGDTTVTGGEK